MLCSSLCPRARIGLAAWVFLFFGAVLPSAFAAEDEKEPPPIEITGEKIKSEGKTGKTTAEGDVVIKYKDKTVWGDLAIYNKETGDGEIEGNARFKDPRSDIKGSRAEFNSITGVGAVYEASGSFDDFYRFSGKKAERLAEDHYHVVDGSVTTCSLDKPHWRVDSGDADITLEDYALLKNVVFRAGGVPIMYLPYFIVPTKTKRATGFLTPGLGYSERDGVQIENSFFWAISDNMDATVSHRYMGDAGNKYAGEFRYIFAEDIYGQLNGEILKETDPDKTEARDLWKVKYDHRHALPWGVRNVIHVDMESEESIDREYSDDVASRTRRYTDSYATFTKSWSARNLYVIMREQKSTLPTSESSVTRLPDISFTNQKERLFGSPFYGALQSGFTSYRTEAESGGVSSRYDVDRFDFYPIVSLPVTFAPWLSAEAVAGFRSTWYSNSIDTSGKQTGESFSREFYTASLSFTGPKVYRLFETGSEAKPRMKHLITPSVTWGYVPGYEFDGDDRRKVYALDRVDNSGAPVNVVTYRISNQLLVKEVLGPEKSRTYQAVRFNVSQSYNINEANRKENPETEKQPFSAVFFDLDTRPFSWLMINYDTTYDVYNAVWPSANLEIGFRYENYFHLALDRGFRRGATGQPDSAWDTVYVEINPPWKLSMDYSVIYDEINEQATDNMIRLRYRDDCWGAALSFSQRKRNVKDTSGVEQLEDETQIMLNITFDGLGDIMGGEEAPLAYRKL